MGKLYYDVYCASLIERKRHWLKKFWDVLRRAPASLRVSTDVTPALLEKLFVAVQSAAYGRNGRLDANTITTAVSVKRGEHDRKNAMNEADSTLRSSAVDAAMNSPRGNRDGKQRSPRRR